MGNIKNRETWLQNATSYFKDLFQLKNYTLPEIQVSVGWPGGSGPKNKAIGQCWSPEMAGDDLHHIFISPAVSDGNLALATLIHELVHATVGIKAGHGPKFRKCAKAMGLAGKMTATIAGPNLKADLDLLIKDKLGEYPHAGLKNSTTGKKGQKSRHIKIECPNKCFGLSVTITKAWIKSCLTPLCPKCLERMAPAPKGGKHD